MTETHPGNFPRQRHRNPGDTATFGSSTQTSPTLSSSISISSITFLPGASAFSIQVPLAGLSLQLQGAGIVNNSVNVQTIDNTGNFSSVGFLNTSTAGDATINNSGEGSFALFSDTSSAGDATIINSGDNSFTAFNLGASGGNAALINANPTAFITIAELSGQGTTVGSIAGNGNLFLGSRNLTVGGNQQSTVFTGVISDGESSKQ